MRLIISSFFIFFLRCYQWFYGIKIPKTEAEKNKVFKFRYDVYINELALQDIKQSDIHSNNSNTKLLALQKSLATMDDEK